MRKINNPELLTTVYEHATDGIVVVDQRGTIRMANPAVCGLFGYRRNELSGQNIQLLTGPGARKLIGKSSELTGRKKDGSVFPFRLTVCEFRHEGDLLYAGILHDLSREKQAESSLIREKQLNQVKTRLVSMASHEFRSPLSRIQLSASLIERYYQRLDQDKIMDHLRKIKLAVADMTDTLNDFLSIERIEAGTMQPENRPFDLEILAAELTEQLQPQARTGLQLIHRHTGTSSQVTLDRTLLRHCLVNLLSNALKYSRESGRIEFDTAITAGNCKITVGDQGIGIPAADQPQLFSAFYRAGNTAGIQGTGLGLHIVKHYVNLMGGTISFKSQEHKGTSFTLRFNRGTDQDHHHR